MIWAAYLLLAQAPAGADLGAKTFQLSCAVGYCHGQGGTANRGPRLRGREFERSFIDRVVRKGIANTAMPGFEGRLKEDELAAVIDYVMRIAVEKGEPAPVAAAGSGAATATAAVVAPGEALFFEATKDIRCGSCHEAAGKGLAIAAMRGGQVQRIRLKSGESFPGVAKPEANGTRTVFDLTTLPAVQRTLRVDEIAAIGPETGWSHRKAAGAYTADEYRAARVWAAQHR